RQFIVRRSRKHASRFEETNVANALVKIMPNRIQQSGQKRLPHAGRLFDDRIGKRDRVYLFSERGNQLKVIRGGNKTQVYRLIISAGRERLPQLPLPCLARV